ncbi:protein scarlet-like [Portunus trituberculatus]|uniref:protein scarlet-like n=1 Tax=Portunus trituberculatus TaxID=210409 RepID=UPI001E1CEFA6|nr:protein scarlet-like [Portunus trituberculatus]XP_045114958.1 protein scarlet-like [Portunus trituberculatus]
MPALEDHQLGETDSLLGSEHNYKFDSSDGSDGYYYKELEDWTHYPGKRISYGTCKQREGITLIWRELSVYVPGKKTCFTRRHNQYQPVKKVLSNVFGAVQPGSLLAMMGASGAGKTTLINALAHRTTGKMVVDGDILINGHKVNEALSTLAGYVHQHDLFLGSITVNEHLTFMTRLKMDRRTTAKERQARVVELLNTLGLAKVQNTLIGTPGSEKSLSGGERKRLAFATEILTDPPLLFCDEPTTGMDSFNAKLMVKIMQDMAKRGKTILCTIHQPSSEIFAMFDRLLLLAEGRVAYMGSSAGALQFFESQGYKCPSTFNPADYFVHTLAVFPGHEGRSQARIDTICHDYTMSPYYKQIEMIIQQEEDICLLNLKYGSSYEEELFHRNTPERPGWLVQWWWLTWRALLDSYRNPTVHYIRIVKKIISALLVGLSYGQIRLNQAGIQDIEGAIYFFVSQNSFPAVYGVLNLFPKEMPLFFREHRNGIYRSDTYYISKMISQIPGFIVDPIVFCCICYWLVGLQSHFYHFSLTVLICIADAITASACGTMVSTAFENLPTILLFLLPFQLVILIYGGLFVNLKSLPWYTAWLKYISWFMYTNEALTVTQWKDIKNITCEMPPGVPCFHTGMEVIEKYAFKPSHLAYDFVMMAVLYCCFHLLGFVALHVRAKKK